MILVFILVLLACALLALSLNRNWKAVTEKTILLPTQRLIRLIGWLMLGVALAICIVVEGGGFGVLMWPLLIALASFIVAMMLSFYPKILRPLASIFVR